MARFYVIETQACSVSWRFPVEAEDENEAIEKYVDGDHGEAEGAPELGDGLDDVQYNLDVELAPPIAEAREAAGAGIAALANAEHHPARDIIDRMSYGRGVEIIHQLLLEGFHIERHK
jgi:hypothetical protein